jgi:hypothetical protein
MGGVVSSAVGWLVGGPIALFLLLIFARRDAVRQLQMRYSAPSWLTPTRRVIALLALVAVVGNALRIAYWAGRL